MKPRLNIMGRKHKIIQLNFDSSNEGQVDSVMYEIKDEQTGEVAYNFLYDADSDLKGVNESVEGLGELIVDDSPSPFTRLIEHLEDMQKEEHNTLTDLAIEMAETKAELPFDSISHLLVQKQNEYFLMQQRVFGVIDTIEEVKAYTEGFYADETDV